MKDFLNKANELFGKGLDTAKKGCKMASQKFSEIEEETKNRLSIVEKEKEVDKLFKELGKKVYRAYINKSKEDTKDICKEIDKILEEKTDLEKNVLKLKDLIVCENCSNTIDIKCSFCPYCGFAQDNKEENIVVEDVVKEEKSEKVKKAKEVKEEVKENKEDKEKPKKEKTVAKSKKEDKPKVATIKLEKNKVSENKEDKTKKATKKTTKKTKEEK